MSIRKPGSHGKEDLETKKKQPPVNHVIHRHYNAVDKDGNKVEKEPQMQGYCVKCKAKSSINGGKPQETKNGRRAHMGGTCSKCGTKMVTMLPNK